MLLEKTIARPDTSNSFARGVGALGDWNHGDSLLTDDHWNRTRDQFLAAVSPRLRASVAWLLSDRRRGGIGLRLWLANIAAGRSPLPVELPSQLIEIYLNNSMAMPLNECQECGMTLPVSQQGYEEETDVAYFSSCPVCGAGTRQ